MYNQKVQVINQEIEAHITEALYANACEYCVDTLDNTKPITNSCYICAEFGHAETITTTYNYFDAISLFFMAFCLIMTIRLFKKKK